ncbi:DUF1761 domain-containing protein [Hoeflea alexandrii]|uniref:DUF1761 domain-containing protein n=1 Tax=Hoeflea alexandrii TaxID=288436 RepID=UPI0022AEA48F|nr:DUF1761 domain-containing protein [Hoeflea alexandrii]MCZ4289579.1 DUF1761 domain-containing protein [Hoeflea alexandrii]
MNFAGMNYLAILVAAIVAFAIGAVYYSTLSKQWMKAARINASGPKPAMIELLVNSFVMELILAFVTAGVIGHLGFDQVTPMNGVISGLFIWAGFIFTTLSINQRYQGYGWDLTLIDGLHWLLVMIGIGLTIGLFGV